MTTTLSKPLVRQVEHDGVSYKVVVSADGIRVTQKGRRIGVALTWDQVLSFDEGGAEETATMGSSPIEAANPNGRLGMPNVIAADVLLLLRRLNETVAEASALIERASELPSMLAKHREPPEPTEKQRSDWYIEPLLTVKQVSQLLNVSTGRVRILPLTALKLDGQVRYRPADLRRYLATLAQSGRPLHRR